MGKVTGSQVSQPDLDPIPKIHMVDGVSPSSCPLHVCTCTRALPQRTLCNTHTYAHTYTPLKYKKHLISPTLNWFLHCAFFILQGHGQMERCPCDGQPVQTTFTLHDWYSLYSIHVSSTHLSLIQYPWQQKLHLSTVCAETLQVVYLDPQMHSAAASAPLHHVCWHSALVTPGIWCP